MTTVIEIPDGPTERPIPGEETGAPTVEDVIETALDIVAVIEEAKDDAEDNGVIEVLSRLAAIEVGIAGLFNAIAALGELMTPPAVEEIEEVLEELEEKDSIPDEVIEEVEIEEVQTPPEKEEVEVATTPQIKVKKSTKWI